MRHAFSSRRLSSRRASRVAAFTLLELLVATAVAGMVLLVINATFFTTLRLHNATHEKIDHDLELQRALGIIRKDLDGIVVPGNPTATTNTFAGQLTSDTSSATDMASIAGERVSPDITTTSGRVDGWTSFSEAQIVAYYLVPANDGSLSNKNLVRVVTRNLLPVQTDDPGDQQTLLTGVTSAAMTFFDGTDWTDVWDSSTSSTLPAAIKFSIVRTPLDNDTARATPAPVDLIVPVLVTTKTTAQQLAAVATTTSP